VAIGVFLINSFASPFFLNPWNLSDATFNFNRKAMIAMAMALLIIAGEIDSRSPAIIALASTAMGSALQMGAGTPELVLIGLGVGLGLRHVQRPARRGRGTAVHRRHNRHE